MIYFQAFGWNFHFNWMIFFAYLLIMGFRIYVFPESRRVVVGNKVLLSEAVSSDLVLAVILAFAVVNAGVPYLRYIVAILGAWTLLALLAAARWVYGKVSTKWVSQAYLNGYRGNGVFIGPAQFLFRNRRKGV